MTKNSKSKTLDHELGHNENKDSSSAQKPVSPASIDPFDLESLTATPSYLAANGIKSAALPVPVRSASGAQVWFRVHPDPTYARVFNTMVWTKDGETYLAAPPVAAGPG